MFDYKTPGFWIALAVIILSVVSLAMPIGTLSTGVFLTLMVILLGIARLV